jgi:hypothetical protein
MTAINASPRWPEGGLYAKEQKDGTYIVIKVLKVDKDVVHIRSYSNVFRSIPKQINESSLYRAGLDHKANEPLGIGHLPVAMESFATWGVTFIQQSDVSPDELDGYRLWLRGGE